MEYQMRNEWDGPYCDPQVCQIEEANHLMSWRRIIIIDTEHQIIMTNLKLDHIKFIRVSHSNSLINVYNKVLGNLTIWYE